MADDAVVPACTDFDSLVSVESAVVVVAAAAVDVFVERVPAGVEQEALVLCLMQHLDSTCWTKESLAAIFRP